MLRSCEEKIQNQFSAKKMLHPLSNIHHNSLIFNLPSNYLKGIWQIRNMNERETITKKGNCMKSLNIDYHQKITWTRPTNGWILVPIIIVTQTLCCEHLHGSSWKYSILPLSRKHHWNYLLNECYKVHPPTLHLIALSCHLLCQLLYLDS